MIGAIVTQLIGLFVDDEFLAAAILAAVAVAGALALVRRRARLGRRPPADAGVAGGARGERVARRVAGAQRRPAMISS